MSQPPDYDRVASFTNLQALSPSTPQPGNTLDAEYNAIKATLDAVLTNLALVQRDDGALANESVGLDQLSTELSAGINTWTVWTTATAYAVADTVFHGSGVYRCATAHTSGVFATDLTAVKWTLVLDFSTLTLVAASQIANTPAGNISSTTVQAALNELDSEKAATSHTHPSSAITDSTAAGRAMLAAASVAAQQTLLGLGSLAYLNTIPVTAITAQLAFTGIISPSIVADANDWAPTGWATASVVRVSASSAVSITGALAASDGDLKIIHNVGAYAITFTSANTASAAANRFQMAGSVVLPPNGTLTIKYDLTTTGWRELSRPLVPLGQVRLAKSGSNLVLSRKNGAYLCINGQNEVVPAAGVSIAASALSNSTVYYVYTYMSAGVMTLELSATAPAVDTSYGWPIKTGDGTRTLVGIIRTSGAGAFVDSATQRFVRSYFNDPGVTFSNTFTIDRSTTSTSVVEVNTEIRVEGVFWADDIWHITIDGQFSASVTGVLVTTRIGVDGTPEAGGASHQPYTANGNGNPSCSTSKQLSEGYHYATLMGLVSGNSGNWVATITTVKGWARRAGS